MVLSADDAVRQVRELAELRNGEKPRINRIYSYLRNKQSFYWLPTGVPTEVRRMAEISRVNVLRFIVDASVQSLFVDGYRAPQQTDNEAVWDAWQANRMDARQTSAHRSAFAYGASYVTVLPGDTGPVIRPVGPRRMTAIYGDDDDWATWALEERNMGRSTLYRLFDDEAVYWVRRDADGRYDLDGLAEHGVGVVPVVRLRDRYEVDDEVIGQVEPYIELQDQVNLTTFSLLVAQHYGAHRQRYVIGWLADSEEEALKASAQRLWMFEDDPEDVKVGEFEQTDLNGYIESREASLRHLATISQTPVHELLGQMANLSAEALAAARDSHTRRLEEHKSVLGESWEQALALAGEMMGQEPDPQAWVRWRDMEGRSLAQTVDALGKSVEMLGIPPQAMWERFADALGAPQQEVERWRALSEEGDGMQQIIDDLERSLQ